jgi:hypothetical protein
MLHCTCCHTCYSIQLMHYSHFKTHSLQHLKPIKCKKRVCKYKTPTCFGLFSRPSSGGLPLCFVPLTIPAADLRSLSLHYYAVCCRMCVSSARVWCSCLLVIWLWTPQADHQQTRTPNTRRWHTHAATYCVIIQTQRTQISGRNNNGTKHSGGPPEDGREKRLKRVGVLYLQTRF